VDGKFHIVKNEESSVPAAGVSTAPSIPAGKSTGQPRSDHQQQAVVEAGKPNAWFKEVLELRKQAGQYRVSFQWFQLLGLKFILGIIHLSVF